MNRTSNRLLLIVLAIVAATATSVRAESGDFSRLWFAPGFYSWHYDKPDNEEIRDDNPGIGFQYDVSARRGYVVGRFINSNNAWSNYIGASWFPLELAGNTARLGVTLAALDGYAYKQGDWFAAAIPTFAYRRKSWGFNLTWAPKIEGKLHGAVSVQLLFAITDFP